MKQKITLAVIAMIISLSGIIVLQLYWINGAIKVRANQFDGQVLDALNEVTRKLQLHESMTILPKILPGLDSIQRKSVDSFYNNRMAHRRNNGNFGLRRRRPGHIADNPFKPDGLQVHEQETPDPGLLSVPETSEKKFAGSNSNDSMMSDSGRKLIAKANIYGRVLRRMMSNYINANQDIHSRLQKKLIDSLLHNELYNRGIDIAYASAILNIHDRHLEFVSQGADTARLWNSTYKASLFADDLRPKPYFLAIYFPDKQNFVLRSIGFILPGSFLFMLIIIISCGYTIYMLLKQKKLSEMKNDFINNMSHEFKTPIATISLAADAIIDPRVMDDKEKLKRYAFMIKEENNRMNLQVQNVLNAAIMDKSDSKVTMSPFDAKTAIEKLVERFRLQVINRQGKLSWKSEADVYTVFGDEVHFENVINNLLDNANKYSQDVPVIEVRAYNEDNMLVIEVEDHGAGMSRETQKKIFDKFYRFSSGNIHDTKGFGLGLSYVKAIVSTLRGTIEVKSELKKGSVFKVKLPLYDGSGLNM